MLCRMPFWLTAFALSAPVFGAAADTVVLPLSGMGNAGETPVYWDFKLDAGRGSGSIKGKEWTRIAVPSCWEQQGFGSYYYGTQGRGKPDDDPVIPRETGTYRREFQIPASWDGRDVHVVFEAAMTDTSVTINGQSAGATHQGGFYRFSYDITKLVHPGRNEIQVVVSKESSNKSVNHAERRGDYWTFGGIYRPVWLEARPRDHIVWTAIDARADGTFYARAHLNHPVAGARLQAQVFDAAGRPTGASVPGGIISADTAIFQAAFSSPAQWTAETPNLYSVKFTLATDAGVVHELTTRFGFRTFEVRPRDGIYLNGRKIVLKGINRHSFDPATGRTLTREQNYADARLIKGANMNAVRMSHYPPDPAFLEAADELGLYVLDELAGWQGFYDTPTGARLIGQIVQRDVNHPSILFWDNGNEGGWNRENDGEFDRWDPQRRPVLHPWAIHSGINTDHYENYDSTVRLSAGPDIFMPTEFLHGLYDGGIGAGLRDYWDVMGRSPTVAGGFFWAFADEGIERTDRDRRIDNMGNAAPDGIVGAHHEKEGSYFAVKEIWSPVELQNLAFADGRVRMNLGNHYDFTDLRHCRLRWRALRLPSAGGQGDAEVIASGRAELPDLAPHARRSWELPVNVGKLAAGELLELTALDRSGQELWTWVVRGAPVARGMAVIPTRARAQGNTVISGGFRLQFDPATGMLAKLDVHGRSFPLRGPRLAAWQRASGLRSFVEAGSAPALRKLELAPEDGTVARAQYDGALREVVWKVRGDELIVSYRIAYEGTADILGIAFDSPEKGVLGKRWLGEGPYRIWKNRQAGTTFGLHEASYSRSTPGVSYEYPEFEGFFGAWDWLELRTRAGKVDIHNLGNIPYFGLYAPTPGEKPILELPDLGWSFLHAIPPIGTKFALPDVLGPQSQPTLFGRPIDGELSFTF
jgi:hypothetical protein